MLLVRAGQALFLCAALATNPAIASRIHRPSTSGHAATSSVKKSHSFRLKKLHGQRTIDPARATEIQAALIKQNYLSGSPSGQWDAQTQMAMQKYQADHGWQTKLMPDSRALINLGLGPNRLVENSALKEAARNSSENPAAPADPAPNTLASVHSISQ